MLFSHGFVPDNFGAGIIVPLIKDKAGDVNSLDNYRAITLTPIIAKVFESFILDVCEVNLATDDLQFGFKRGSGCNDAIFALKMIINYFTTNKSTIFAAALDIRKAFDRVQHRKLIDSLYKAGIPDYVIAILANWYAKLTAVVRWNNELSKSFAVRSGVRQGSVLSPSLFNVFINAIIVNLKRANTGCHVYGQFMGCLLYADDIILLSPSFKGLQHMLDICHNVSSSLEFSFNCLKSHCICFGAMYKYRLEPMLLGNESINWVSQITYLGVRICGGRSLSFDLSATKQAFFSASSCIYANAKFNDQIIHLSLQETFCKPILTYGIVAMHLTVEQTRILNCCWNSVYRRIFGFNKWESVSCFICGLGRLDLHHIILLSRAKFYKHLNNISNLVLNTLYRLLCGTAYNSDAGLSLAQLPYGLLKVCIFNDFTRQTSRYFS
jgi:hypothetical protein